MSYKHVEPHVIHKVQFFYVLLWESLSSENLVAMFFFCNTHYVVAAAQFLWRGWIWICCSVLPSIRLVVFLIGPNLSTLHLLPPWPGWMNDDVALWWPGAGWLTDGLLMWWRIAAVPVQRRSHHRRSRKRSRSVEDDGEGHLIYHSGDMLRARCIEYIPFFSTVVHFVSHSLVIRFLFPNINLKDEVFGPIVVNIVPVSVTFLAFSFMPVFRSLLQ